MKKILLLSLFLLLLTPLFSFTEEQPQPEIESPLPEHNQNLRSEFYQALTALQVINSEFGIKASVLMSFGQPLSANDERWIGRRIQKALVLVEKIIELSKTLPFKVKGFAVGFPSGITIDFEFKD